MNAPNQQRQQAAEPVTQGEFERLIGEPVASRTYIPKMELTARQRRDLQDVRKRLIEEARLMGESAFYGWGAGKDRIEGASVKIAMAAVRCWGNCSVEAMPLQETHDAYVFTSRFIDLETGYTLERQFRQSKRSLVYGKHDDERKADIRFQIGQSKAARNLVLNALPEWLIDEAVEVAKEGVREKVEKYIETNGIAAAVDMVVRGLVKAAVPEPLILAKCGKAKREALTVDDIVLLRGCLKAIQDGAERASDIFPAEAQPTTDLRERAKQVAAADRATVEQHPGDAEAADAARNIHEQTPSAPPAPEQDEGFDPREEWVAELKRATTESAAVAVAGQAMEAGFNIDAELAAMKTKAGGRKQTKLPGE